MKNKRGVKKVVQGTLLKAATIVFFGSLMANGLQYVFHFVTGRLLGPSDYGALTAILALVTILIVPFNAAGLSITKQISLLAAKKKDKEINFLLKKYSINGLIAGSATFVLLVLFSSAIANFLHAPLEAILLVCASCIFLAPATIISSVLNGLSRFKASMASNLFNAGGKLFFGVGLLILGFGLIGAVFGVTIGGIIWLLVCIFFVLKRTSGEKKKVLFSMKNDLVLITATLLLLNLLNNIDMILARSLLPANEAGIYGAASQIGKIIFFLTSGLSIIVIPKTSEKIALRENSTKVIRQTTAIIIGISVIPLLLVWAFPNLMVTLMYGKDFFAASNVILISCLAMTIFSATYSVAHYFIARNKKSILPILLIFNALEVALILVNHSSALAIALDVLVSVGLLLLVLFVQSIISLKKKNKN